MLRYRLITGTLLALLIVGLTVLDGWLATRPLPDWRLSASGINFAAFAFNGGITALVVGVFALMAAREVVKFARIRGYAPFPRIALLFSLGFVVGPFIAINWRIQTGWYDDSWQVFWLSLALIGSFLSQGWRRSTPNAAANIASTLFVIAYVGVLPGFLVKLRMEVGGPAGDAVLILSILAVKMTDTGAYFVGRLLGRHRMIEWLSPKKTWEGFVGGLVVTMLATWGVGALLQRNGLIELPEGPLAAPWGLLAFGLLMGLCSVVGDLCASLLKRDAAAKDSGTTLPGMGGMLDVFDSPLIAAPFAWFFWTRLVPALGGGA